MINEHENLANRKNKRDVRKQTGKIGEEAAYLYLLESNYTILARNWSCRIGEIDIIAELADRVIFVEVRTRKEQGRFGTAVESVDRRKQHKVRDTAQVYLRSVGRSDGFIRFDVIAITLSRLEEQVIACKHVEGAF